MRPQNIASVLGLAGLLGGAASVALAQPSLLLNNGEFVTSQGTGFNGADVSQSQVNPTGDGVTYVGLGINESTAGGGPFRNGCDFVVPAGQRWVLTKMEYYAFQSQSSNFSTTFAFSGAFATLYDGRPSAGASVLAGDYTTNRLLGGAFSGVYRTSSGTTGQQSNSRPIMRVDIDLSWLPALEAGEYVLGVSMTGDPARAGGVQSILVTPNPAGASSERFANVSPFNGWFNAPLEWPFRLYGFALPARNVCDSLDFNNDQIFPDDADLTDLLNVLAGGVCNTCNDVDFNNDGVFPDEGDLEAFLRVLAGGQC